MLADRSAAYLAMWIALDRFNPQADRWAEPVSFGARDKRIQDAREAVELLRRRHEGKLGPETERDIRAFEEQIDRLRSDSSFRPEAAELARRLRALGRALAKESVELAGLASR